jgi:anti-sigma regulatory factor (Ser/Thr protein kinase)
MEERITISNSVEELAVLAGRIEELAEQWELPMPLTMNLNLVLEETVSNIIFYAYPDGNEHSIDITLSMSESEITIVIEDEGVPFDPTAMQQPDISLPAEDRPIGGLGIFLVSKIMDNVSYSREQEKNKLTLKKKIQL